jgi:AcrR family transcriptional regulator
MTNRPVFDATPARRAALSSDRILQEALQMIDLDGLEAFSYRALAARLGCQAMSLYHYFPSKAHLLEALTGVLLAEAMDYPPNGPWPDRLRAAAGAYRQMALRHPGMFLHFSRFRMTTREGLAFLEGHLAILENAGLAPQPRARHFQMLRHYLLGACLDAIDKGIAATDPLPFNEARRISPGLMAVGPHLVADRQNEHFEAGITELIEAITSDLTR